MKIAISGASGLIGSRVAHRLTAGGHRIYRLVRRPVRDHESEIHWHAKQGRIDRDGLKEMDVVVHLAGKPIATLWTEKNKREIFESRQTGTRLIAETLAELKEGPRLLISASATGYYGDTGEAGRTEEDGPGEGFLADVCREWEAAADPAREAGLRVVHPRFGVVLASEGGMLPKMLPAFRIGLGAVVGDGSQQMSWVHIEDAARALEHMLAEESLAGPVNVTSPEPVRNDVFTRELAGRLDHEPRLKLPAGLLKLASGGMAEEMLLASSRVLPERLKESGFRFSYPELSSALRDLVRP